MSDSTNSNWTNNLIVSFLCTGISVLALVYHLDRLFRVQKIKSWSALSRNAFLCLIGLVFTVLLFLFIAFAYAWGNTTPYACLGLSLVSDISNCLRNILMIAYFAQRLSLVLHTRKVAINRSLITIIVLQIGTAFFLFLNRTLSWDVLQGRCVPSYTYSIPVVFFPYLIAVTLPILVFNGLFTYTLIKTILALPTNTTGLAYLKRSSARTDLINVIITLLAIIASSGGSDSVYLNQLSNLLYSSVFHFGLMLKATNNAGTNTGTNTSTVNRLGTKGNGSTLDANSSKALQSTTKIGQST